MRKPALILASALFSAAAFAGPSGGAPVASGIDRSGFDPAVRAQDDLFRHVNGRWLATF